MTGPHLTTSEAARVVGSLVDDIANAVAAGDTTAAAAALTDLNHIDPAAAVAAVDAATDTAGAQWVAEHFGNGRPT